MCGFMVGHLDLKKLTRQQKTNLKKELQRRRDALRAKIKHHQATVRDLNKGINKL
jgi:hypothetical protein